MLGLRDNILQVPRWGKKDLEALRGYFREKFREMGIEQLPLEQLDKSS